MHNNEDQLRNLGWFDKLIVKYYFFFFGKYYDLKDCFKNNIFGEDQYL